MTVLFFIFFLMETEVEKKIFYYFIQINLTFRVTFVRKNIKNKICQKAKLVLLVLFHLLIMLL